MIPAILELILFLSSVAALVAAIVRCTQRHGWKRFAWILLAVVWSWIVLGEILLNLGWQDLIYRWLRAIPARVLTAVAFWILVWRGRGGRNGGSR